MTSIPDSPVVVDNARERLGLQARAADERAVHVRLFHQPRDVVGFDGAAVEDAERGGRFLREPTRENAPDKRVHLLRLLRRRCTPRPDGPDRFVGDNDTFEVGGCQITQAALDLPLHYSFGHAAVALLQSLADADDDAQPRLQGGQRLAVHEVVGLVVELPPLRVADDDVRRARVAQHVGRDLARVRAVLRLGRAVLTGDVYVGAFEAVGHRLQGGEGGRDDHVAVVGVRHQGLQIDRGLHRLADQLVHLPVPGYDRFSIHLSLSAATPGSSSPARNSSVAPPPVEMCVILSASPACWMAETESPPPTMTVAPFSAASATACASPTVPSSKPFSSNMPIGPFQMMVLAPSSSRAKRATVSRPMSRPTSPWLVNSTGMVLRLLSGS